MVADPSVVGVAQLFLGGHIQRDTHLLSVSPSAVFHRLQNSLGVALVLIQFLLCHGSLVAFLDRVSVVLI